MSELITVFVFKTTWKLVGRQKEFLHVVELACIPRVGDRIQPNYNSDNSYKVKDVLLVNGGEVEVYV